MRRAALRQVCVIVKNLVASFDFTIACHNVSMAKQVVEEWDMC